jgi:hypothetical protein
MQQRPSTTPLKAEQNFRFHGDAYEVLPRSASGGSGGCHDGQATGPPGDRVKNHHK